MNRSIVLVGVGIVLAGLALVASPIALTGAEQFTLEQEAGIFVSPVGLLVVMIGAVQPNPETTTVGGTFGNPDAGPRRSGATRTAEMARPPLGFNPREPVNCRHCRTVIAFDLARCPRCARPRECRSCGRPLAMEAERANCPGCRRVEAFCNCPRLPRPPVSTTPSIPSRTRRL